MEMSELDKPTEVSLYDTLNILEKSFLDWKNDEFAKKIFIWNSSIFLEDHVVEVCQKHCPDILPLCQEYRTQKTINGNSLPPDFGRNAILYMIDFFERPHRESLKAGQLGSAPVDSTYFHIIEKKYE